MGKKKGNCDFLAKLPYCFLRSAEFRSACSRLNQVFRSTESGPLYGELGLEQSGIGVARFLEALNERVTFFVTLLFSVHSHDVNLFF